MHQTALSSPHKILRDSHGRNINYLRLSVTDRCNMRCTYCMAEAMQFLPQSERLSTDEMIDLAHHFIDSGITHIRLTGGEPLVHPDIIEIATAIGARLNPEHGMQLRELTLSTNGAMLGQYAADLHRAGIRRVNVSLDTLDPNAFATITRTGRIADVLGGIEAALSAGLCVKINMVALQGQPASALVDMFDYCHARGIDLTLIEAMPVGDIAVSRCKQYVALPEFLAPVGGLNALTPIAYRSSGPARYAAHPDYPGLKIGLISAISNNFCAHCNRIRVTAQGRVYMCLGQDDHVDLRAALRSDDPLALAVAIDTALRRKPLRHDFAIAAVGPGHAVPNHYVARHMSATGG